MRYSCLDAPNPFSAPVFGIAVTESTMNDAKCLAAEGAADGTAVVADFQEAGRGRIEGRRWESKTGESLLCTVLLRRKPIAGFTIRVGLAVSLTLDEFLPVSRKSRVKWPNDVLVGGKKAAGILCENDGAAIYVGVGINLAQRAFPDDLSHRATSLALERETGFGPGTGFTGENGVQGIVPERNEVLAAYLRNLKTCLSRDDWRDAVYQRLYGRGELVTFLSGDPDKGEKITGFVEGIGDSGELLFRRETGEIERLWSGEFPYPEG